MSKRTRLLGRLKHVYSHNAKLVLDVDNNDIGLIIEGVEKQIRKKPKDIVTLEVPFDDEVDVKMGNCAICGYDVHSDISEYCPNCGQKQNWSEVE